MKQCLFVYTVITFEEKDITSHGVVDRINKVNQSGLPWLVAEDEGKVVGYAYATNWKGVQKCWLQIW